MLRCVCVCVYDFLCTLNVIFHSSLFKQWLYHSSGLYWFYRWWCRIIVTVNEGNLPQGTTSVISHGYSDWSWYGNCNGSKSELKCKSQKDKYLIFFRVFVLFSYAVVSELFIITVQPNIRRTKYTKWKNISMALYEIHM